MEKEIYFNLYPLKIVYETVRKYYYYEDGDSFLFAKNISRVNNMKFVPSNDLIWGEFLNIETELIPSELKKFEINKTEIISAEKDKRLFEKTFYRHIKKIFLDNDFIYRHRNKFLSKKESFLLESNKNIRAHRSYEVKLYKFEDKYFAAVLPFLTFLSAEPVMTSKVKSSWAVNIVSGKSYMCIKQDGKFIIDIKGRGKKEINHPENYYYNFNSEESAENSFSEEINSLYKGDVYREITQLESKLNFLSSIVDFSNGEKAEKKKLQFSINYKFENGESKDYKDIFRYNVKENGKKLNLLFFFESEEKFEKNYSKFKRVFADKESVFYETLRQMGIESYNFVKNPENGKSMFVYDRDNMRLDKSCIEFLNSLDENENYAAVVVLENYVGNLEQMIKSFPKHIIFQPVLKENIIGMKPFIIKSYAYKVATFIKNKTPILIKELDDCSNSMFIGMDLNHDTEGRITNFAISAVDSNGKIIYLKKYGNMELNEKIDENKIELEIVNSINEYKEINRNLPENIYLYRDGVFLEECGYIERVIKNFGINPILIEINKNSKIMSSKETKNSLYKMSSTNYIFYPFNYLNQKGIEINIVSNESRKENDKVAQESVAMTHIYHGSPYSNLKLPYPVHISDKVARSNYEWRLYIPYLK